LKAVDYGVRVQVEVSHTRQEELRLRIGDLVYVSPRRVRVFVPEQPADYSI
ncbi:MAG: sulfate ABC transporter ATP-binding protein, partial [Planctomycetia bacterium]|nr:sulfate ABC transporter ATP-binding protein [Planctomycetia bacterium]